MAMLSKDDVSQHADDRLTALFEAGLAHDDGEAARAHLQAGRPVHYVEESTPKGHVIREHPIGVCEMLRVDADGSTHVIGGI